MVFKAERKTGLILQEKAKMLYREYKISNSLNASSGWLQKFKKRFGIRYLKSTDKKLLLQPQLVKLFKSSQKDKIAKLQLVKEHFHNADETGLYWKLFPEKTYVARKEKTAPGRKTEKQRVTFLARTNAPGSHKLKPLVIDNEKNRRAFCNINCLVNYILQKSMNDRGNF